MYKEGIKVKNKHIKNNVINMNNNNVINNVINNVKMCDINNNNKLM